ALLVSGNDTVAAAIADRPLGVRRRREASPPGFLLALVTAVAARRVGVVALFAAVEHAVAALRAVAVGADETRVDRPAVAAATVAAPRVAVVTRFVGVLLTIPTKLTVDTRSCTVPVVLDAQAVGSAPGAVAGTRVADLASFADPVAALVAGDPPRSWAAPTVLERAALGAAVVRGVDS